MSYKTTSEKDMEALFNTPKFEDDGKSTLPSDWEEQQKAKDSRLAAAWGDREDSRDLAGMRRVAAEAAERKNGTSGGRRSMRSRRRSRKTRRSRRYRR